MMAISHPIRQKILQHCSSGELKQIAQKEDEDLERDGWRLVEAGVTTPDEILRVIKDDVLSFR